MHILVGLDEYGLVCKVFFPPLRASPDACACLFVSLSHYFLFDWVFIFTALCSFRKCNINIHRWTQLLHTVFIRSVSNFFLVHTRVPRRVCFWRSTERWRIVSSKLTMRLMYDVWSWWWRWLECTYTKQSRAEQNRAYKMYWCRKAAKLIAVHFSHFARRMVNFV